MFTITNIEGRGFGGIYRTLTEAQWDSWGFARDHNGAVFIIFDDKGDEVYRTPYAAQENFYVQKENYEYSVQYIKAGSTRGGTYVGWFTTESEAIEHARTAQISYNLGLILAAELIGIDIDRLIQRLPAQK